MGDVTENVDGEAGVCVVSGFGGDGDEIVGARHGHGPEKEGVENGKGSDVGANREGQR
jgi:hypothetical protein